MDEFLKMKKKLEKQGHLVVGGEDEEDCGACKPRAGNLYGSDRRRQFRSQQRISKKTSAEDEASSSSTSTATSTASFRDQPPPETPSAAGTAEQASSTGQGRAEEQEESSGGFYDEESYWDKQEAADVIELGQAGWTLLHSMAAHYPRHPSAQHQERMRTFLSLLPHLYPCRICAKDFEGILREMPPSVESRDSLSLWMCRAHNHVNRQLGKPLFPCERVLERWLPASADKEKADLD